MLNVSASLKEALSIIWCVGPSVCNAFIKFAEKRRKKQEATRRKGDKEKEVTRKNEQQGGRSNEEEGAARRIEQRGGRSRENSCLSVCQWKKNEN